MSEPATVSSLQASVPTASDSGVPACVRGMCDPFPDKALPRRHIKNFYLVILKKRKKKKKTEEKKTNVLPSQICFKRLMIRRASQRRSEDGRLQTPHQSLGGHAPHLRTELCTFPLDGGTGLCSQAGARSCVEHSRNVWHPVSYAGCTLAGWCHARRKAYIWADINHTRPTWAPGRKPRFTLKPQISRGHRRDLRLPKDSYSTGGNHPPSHRLFFFQPHWCSCTRNINPTWEVWGPVAKASMGRPESKPQPFSVMSHGHKDFPTRIRSHDRSAAVEMLIWFGLWCEGATNYCSSARRHCDWLSLRYRAHHAWIAGGSKVRKFRFCTMSRSWPTLCSHAGSFDSIISCTPTHWPFKLGPTELPNIFNIFFYVFFFFTFYQI